MNCGLTLVKEWNLIRRRALGCFLMFGSSVSAVASFSSGLAQCSETNPPTTFKRSRFLAPAASSSMAATAAPLFIRLSTNGNQYSRDAQRYSYYDDGAHNVHRLQPASGPTKGDTLVRVPARVYLHLRLLHI